MGDRIWMPTRLVWGNCVVELMKGRWVARIGNYALMNRKRDGRKRFTSAAEAIEATEQELAKQVNKR